MFVSICLTEYRINVSLNMKFSFSSPQYRESIFITYCLPAIQHTEVYFKKYKNNKNIVLHFSTHCVIITLNLFTSTLQSWNSYVFIKLFTFCAVRTVVKCILLYSYISDFSLRFNITFFILYSKTYIKEKVGLTETCL